MPQKKAKAKFQYRTKRTFPSGTKKTKTFIYLTEEEHETLKEAAANDRSSLSGFVADAALDRAEQMLRNLPKK